MLIETEEVIVSHNKTVPGVLFLAVSSDHKLECVQKKEKIDRACNIYAGKDWGWKFLFSHIRMVAMCKTI